MNILINAISITEGGGLVVLNKLLASMIQIDLTTKWYVAANPNTLSKIPNNPAIIKLSYDWINKSPFHLIYWYEFILPRLIVKNKIDLCFSQTNFLPRRKLSCPTLLLIQQAGFFSEKFQQLHLEYYQKPWSYFLWRKKINWTHASIKLATHVTVQTQAIAKKISEQVSIEDEKITVVPHGPGCIHSLAQYPKSYPKNKIWRIGYVTKFGVQKDFNTAFQAVNLLKNKGVSIKLVLTLSANTPEYQKMLRQIQLYKIEENIENYGEVASQDHIKEIYESLHIFIFPSLCESFGFTLIEAMAMGLPIVMADTESNREISGGACEIVNPEDGEMMAEKIYQIISSESSYVAASKKSIARARNYSWDNTGKQIWSIMNAMLTSQ